MQFDERGFRRFARPDETYQVRYTVMVAEVFEALSYILFEKRLDREAVIIDGQPYQIVGISAEPVATEGWGKLTSFEQMMEEAGISDKLILEFKSPPTFRQGKVQLLYPLPENVFGSYMRRWNGTATVELDSSKISDAAVEHVVAERYRLETRVMPYGEAQYNGFLGYCQYRILTDDLETRRVFNLLADFALFAGTGQKTTQGMGQTRRLTEVPRTALVDSVRNGCYNSTRLSMPQPRRTSASELEREIARKRRKRLAAHWPKSARFDPILGICQGGSARCSGERD